MTQHLRLDAILDAAHERTRIGEFDNDSFLEGLTLVVDEVNAGGGCEHPQFPAMLGDVEKWLDARLRVSEYAREHDAVLGAPLEQPILIIGPRATRGCGECPGTAASCRAGARTAGREHVRR